LNQKKELIVFVVLAVFIFSFGCIGVTQQDTIGQDSAQISAEQSIQETTIKEFTLTAKKWEFEPSVITVNQGDKVKLSITSIDVSHGISLPEFGVNEILSPGQTVVIEFVADRKGSFDFFCSVYCGTGHGSMAGQLIVK
jgi:cytochrome c oxidase subunit 2